MIHLLIFARVSRQPVARNPVSEPTPMNLKPVSMRLFKWSTPLPKAMPGATPEDRHASTTLSIALTTSGWKYSPLCPILGNKERLENYREDCLRYMESLGLESRVCGKCIKACTDSPVFMENRTRPRETASGVYYIK